MILKLNPTSTNYPKVLIVFWGGIAVATYIALALYSRPTQLSNVTSFIGILTLAFCAYAGAALVFFRTFSNTKVQPSVALIILFSVAFHSIGIAASPQFEDDYFRYLWDGYVFFEYGDPYAHPPSFYFSDESIPYAYQHLLNNINYPDIKTIYSPLLQYSFWLSHALFPADITGLKILYSLCNFGVILLLSQRVAPRYVLLYAWNPLLIKEIAFTAHPDVLGVLFLMLAIFFISTRPKLAAGFLAVSVCSKPFAWLVACYLVLRFNVKQWLIFLGCIVLLYLPFTLNGDIFSGLVAFGNDWEFNAALFSLFGLFLSPPIAKVLSGLILISLLLYYYRHFRNDTSDNIRGDIVIGSLLLLAPVINPWYLVWLLPFATIHFTITPWVASFALLLSYFSGINMLNNDLQAYELASWVKPIEYLLIFSALAFDIKSKFSNKVTV